jgi:hypothetical protein
MRMNTSKREVFNCSRLQSMTPTLDTVQWRQEVEPGYASPNAETSLPNVACIDF